MTITELLDQYRVPYRQHGEDHHVSTGWIGFHCPQCGIEDGPYHAGIKLATNYCSCWQCGHMPLIDTLAKLTRQPWAKIKELIQRIPLPRETEERPVGCLTIPTGIGPLQKPHRDYLEQRGFDPDQLVRLWGIQGIGLASYLPWRLWIPIHYYSKVVSWTTRSIHESGLRYISANPEQESIHGKNLLYGEHYTRHAVIVCEGPTDVWNLGPGAVGTLGLGFTNKQLCKIARYPIRAICFDSSVSAQARASKLCEDLAVFPGKTIRVELDAADPGSASKEEVAKLRKEFLE